MLGLSFPEALNTSLTVDEYPLVSRPLLLPDGASDAFLLDMNGDLLDDLVVSVYKSKTVSIFYRQPNGELPTYPSYNLTTQNNPLAIEPMDAFQTGSRQIVALEVNPVYGNKRMAIYNLTSDDSYETWPDQGAPANTKEIIVADLSGDEFPDIALLYEGQVEVYFGPDFVVNLTSIVLTTNPSSIQMDTGDFDGDALLELAVVNETIVQVFHQPLKFTSESLWNLSVEGTSVDIASGFLDGDASCDLAVATATPSAVHFYFQSVGSLPTAPDRNISLEAKPSSIRTQDIDGDTHEDILVLSIASNASYGYYQGSDDPIWRSVPDFRFPVAGSPRAAVVGDMDGDGLSDIAVVSSRADWSGPGLVLYPSRQPTYSNCNATAWFDQACSPLAIATGDLDNDSVQDLVFIDGVSGLIGCMFSFREPVFPIDLGFEPGDLMVADLNLDGLYDILAVEKSGAHIAVVMGADPFTGSYYEISSGGRITDVAIGDLNSDGFPDLLAATAETPLLIFNNTRGPAPFSSYVGIGSTPSGVWSVTIGDFNSDGMDDLAYTKPVRTVAVMLQSALVWFGPNSAVHNLTHSVGTDFTSLWSGDVTGDNKTDIVTMRNGDSALYLFDQNDFETAQHPFGTLVLPETPKFVSVLDATDDGHSDVVAIFSDADLLYLYWNRSGILPSTLQASMPSMVFVAGAGPVYAAIGDGTGDDRGDLLVVAAGSHAVSAWQQINRAPVAHAGGPYVTRQGSLLQINGTVETGTSERPYMEYWWDFGDGQNSDWTKQLRPLHNYTDMGTKTLTMTAKDPMGLTSTSVTTVDVWDSIPLISFSWSPTNISEGRNITFKDNTWSYDPVVFRDWRVDGQSLGDHDSIVVEFQNSTHTVELEEEDSDGSRVSLAHIVDVHPMPPELNLMVYGPQPFMEGYSVTFNVSVDGWHTVFDGSAWVQEPVDPIVSYEWDFSNVPDTFVPDTSAPNSMNVTHVFSATGDTKVFRVAVRVTDSDGEVNITSCDVWVEDIGPIAVVALSTADPQEGVAFHFEDNSLSHDGIVNWTWELRYPDGTSENWALDGRAMQEIEFSDLQDGNYTMSLGVFEADGDVNTTSIDFVVREIPPFVEFFTVPSPEWDGYYQEFYWVELAAYASGLDPAVLFEWDFIAPATGFFMDFSTTGGSAWFPYLAVGNYTAKVRVTDSDGQKTVEAINVEIRHKEFVGDFYTHVRVTRDMNDTDIVTFDFVVLRALYQDIVHMSFDYGDGNATSVDGPPIQNLTHVYVPGTDYLVTATVRDDDGYTYVMTEVVWCRLPEIIQVSPEPNGVIKRGIPVVFLINQGSTLLDYCYYSVQDIYSPPGSDQGFAWFDDLYVLNTSAWPDWTQRIQVVARDLGGNIVRYNTTITVDSTDPFAILSSSKTAAFGGDRINISIAVDDKNVDASGVTLFVRFQGESAYSTYGVRKAATGGYYKVLELPIREGQIELYANVTDRAGNSFQTEVYSMVIELRFIHWAWPYLLTAALVAALGTAGYFVREQKIAIDEVFVIYRDGRMIAHSTRRLKPGMDDHVLGGMLVAIQDFVRESFKDITSFRLRRLEFGEKSVLVEKGEHVYVAVLLHGQTSRKIAVKMQMAVDEIESRFARHLKDWDGDLEKLRGVSDLVKKLYSRMPMFPGRRARQA